MAFYNRKSPRISYYDYSRENYYFITICTHERHCYFGSIHAKSWIGELAEAHLRQIPNHYTDVSVDKFVVMPNHIHMILVIQSGGKWSVEQIIGQYKSGVSRQARKKYPSLCLWQRSFHDRVIRSQKDYERIWLYIEGNPLCWKKDCFYLEV